jgi:hypothetical protein
LKTFHAAPLCKLGVCQLHFDVYKSSNLVRENLSLLPKVIGVKSDLLVLGLIQSENLIRAQVAFWQGVNRSHIFAVSFSVGDWLTIRLSNDVFLKCFKADQKPLVQCLTYEQKAFRIWRIAGWLLSVPWRSAGLVVLGQC